MRAAIVGLGAMGGPIAANLLRAGLPVLVHDLDAGRVARLVADGAAAAGSLAGAAQAETVLVSVPGPPELEEVAVALLGALAPGSALVNLSTVGPAQVRRLAAQAGDRGIDLIDAPVTGAADGARAGTLTVMAGAEAAALDRVRPVLDAFASTVVHVGPPGAGSAAKLLTNMLWFTHVVALADALALAVAAGIAARDFAALVPRSAGASWVAAHDLPNVLAGNDDPSFTLALCRKDLRLIRELAADLGMPSDLADAAARRFEEAYERFGPGVGELAVARLSEERAGVSIRG